MNLLYHNPTPNQNPQSPYPPLYSTLHHLLKQPHIILFITPLTHQTYHIIRQPQFKLINQTPLFLNISPPKTV
ncbi:NAD(P)-dependent oxidoreductase, partial [Bacillus pumilus]|uniref:NAD(P)-dependent oxidoreductase n=1 Tax=Bacillus pumilus TaxID=1408 RepID=UPI0034D982FC